MRPITKDGDLIYELVGPHYGPYPSIDKIITELYGGWHNVDKQIWELEHVESGLKDRLKKHEKEDNFRLSPLELFFMSKNILIENTPSMEMPDTSFNNLSQECSKESIINLKKELVKTYMNYIIDYYQQKNKILDLPFDEKRKYYNVLFARAHEFQLHPTGNHGIIRLPLMILQKDRKDDYKKTFEIYKPKVDSIKKSVDQFCDSIDEFRGLIDNIIGGMTKLPEICSKIKRPATFTNVFGLGIVPYYKSLNDYFELYMERNK